MGTLRAVLNGIRALPTLEALELDVGALLQQGEVIPAIKHLVRNTLCLRQLELRGKTWRHVWLQAGGVGRAACPRRERQALVAALTSAVSEFGCEVRVGPSALGPMHTFTRLDSEATQQI